MLKQIQLRSKVQQEFALVNNALHRATRMTLETGGLTCVAAAAQLFLSLNATNRRYYFYILWAYIVGPHFSG